MNLFGSRIRAVARPSHHSVWVCRGPLDDKITFMPKCDKISLNRDFFVVEDRCADLFSWLRVQTTPQLALNAPSFSTVQAAATAGSFKEVAFLG